MLWQIIQYIWFFHVYTCVNRYVHCVSVEKRNVCVTLISLNTHSSLWSGLWKRFHQASLLSLKEHFKSYINFQWCSEICDEYTPDPCPVVIHIKKCLPLTLHIHLFSHCRDEDVRLNQKSKGAEWLTVLYLDWSKADPESCLKLREVDSSYNWIVWKHSSQPVSTHCSTCLSQCFLFVALCKVLCTLPANES